MFDSADVKPADSTPPAPQASPPQRPDPPTLGNLFFPPIACPRCAHDFAHVPKSATFCPRCGLNLKQMRAPATAPAAPPSPLVIDVASLVASGPQRWRGVRLYLAKMVSQWLTR